MKILAILALIGAFDASHCTVQRTLGNEIYLGPDGQICGEISTRAGIYIARIASPSSRTDFSTYAAANTFMKSHCQVDSK